jgi:hypothetical protein
VTLFTPSQVLDFRVIPAFSRLFQPFQGHPLAMGVMPMKAT